jgi:rod shape-determining protein MreC
MVLSVRKQVLIALAGALVFHILILSLQANQKPGPGVARVWLLDALVPMEMLVDRGVEGVWSLWDGYVALLHVREENQNLKAENEKLRMDVARRDEDTREATRLRSLLSLADSGLGKTVAARVIGRDPSRTPQTVTIDRGTSHGVMQNAAVITPDGVVGRVIAASRFFAVVQLITDAQSKTGALLRESRVQAVFRGSGGGELELDYIDNDSEIVEGNELVTSGLDQIYPKGLPLGVITSVGPRKGLFKVVRARPHAVMGRLEEVLVIIEAAQPEPEPQEAVPGALPS